HDAIVDRPSRPDPQVVAELARAHVRGMLPGGMPAALKHSPGHGTVQEDTLADDAIDPRPLEALRAGDLVPFVAGIEAGADAVMMARVPYPAIAPDPAGSSPLRIGQFLRAELGFRGGVASDGLG